MYNLICKLYYDNRSCSDHFTVLKLLFLSTSKKTMLGIIINSFVKTKVHCYKLLVTVIFEKSYCHQITLNIIKYLKYAYPGND